MVLLHDASTLNHSAMYRTNESVGLDLVARTVDQFIQTDSSYPQLLDHFKAVGDLPNHSGQHDPDYPGLVHLSRSLKSLSQVAPIKKVPLPAELVEQFGHMQSYCEMGLFPEIGRGWLTIDKDIFVWTFEDGGDLAYFDGLSETILAVGLVRPKIGIFQKHIQFLLCLATPVEIVLLGVSFSRKRDDSPLYEEMHLLPEPLFSIATDNIHIVTIVGTLNGRIFMGSKDGSILELAYQAEDGWFHRKCRKINHSSSSFSFLIPQFLNMAFYEEDPIVQIEIDESRHILYSRSEKGSIQVFDLGVDGTQMNKVAFMSPSNILDDAVKHARVGDRSALKAIIHISMISQSESTNVHLVAITQTGVRLYFTTTSVIQPGADPRPYTLALMHVRFPPGHSVGGSPLQPDHVHKAHYSNGTLVLASPKGDNDLLWVMSNDAFPSQQRLLELHTVVSISGKCWVLKEIPLPSLVSHSVRFTPNVPPDPPTLVIEHSKPPRKFVALSPQGSHIIVKLQPVDQLRQLLVDNQGPECEAVKSFFSLLKEPQACAVSLILACSQHPQDKQVSEWATSAFFLYGNETHSSGSHQIYSTGSSLIPTSAWHPSSPLPVAHSTVIGSPMQASTPALHNMSYQSIYGGPGFGQAPTDFPHQLQSGVAPSPMEGIFSAKHNGLYFYFGRIIRYIWNKRLINDISSREIKPAKDLAVSSITSQELSNYLEKISALKHFFLIYAHQIINVHPGRKPETLSPALGGHFRPDDVSHSEHQRRNEELHLQEKISLSHLKQLIHQCHEVLGLWKVLCDHQLHVVAETLSKEMQAQLKSFTFRDLVVAGSELGSALVTALIHHYLDDNATTDAISNRLREVCPSIFRREDAVFSKAHEKLMLVRTVGNKYEKEQLLKEALQLCQEISPQLQLPAVCRLFCSVHYYEGVVDLCLSASKKRDPQDLATHYYRNGEPLEDRQGLQAYASRMECYKAVIDTLGFLMNLSASHPQSPSIPKSPGAAPPPEAGMLTPEEAKGYLERVLQLSLKSDDELFHTALYSWLIDQKHTDRLLEVKSPFVEPYLNRCIETHPESLSSMDLMWKYYEKNHNFSAAARILVKLAERHSPEVSLQQRLEYLSRATICVKSSELRITSSVMEGDFLYEIEEKMEVARIQQQILQSLQQRQPQHPNFINAISRLNSDLIDISKLYEEYADPFDLPEAQLAIIHCSDHFDPLLVENLWQKIVDRELQSTISNTPSGRMSALGNKIKTLGRIYISSQKYFPIAFLVKYLEFRSSTASFESSWVFTVLLSVGVTFPQLVEVYHKVYKSRDPCWRSIKKPHHLLISICQLFLHFANNPKVVLSNERRAFASNCLDLVATYLVDLQADSLTEGVQQLMSRFRDVQYRLERTV